MCEFIRKGGGGGKRVSQICYVTVRGGLKVIVTDRYKRKIGR